MNTRKLHHGAKNGVPGRQQKDTQTSDHGVHALRLKMLPALLASSFGVAGLLLPGMALANPQGGQVVAGQATFNQQGNLLTITNTPNAIINWQNFSINANEITRFLQQNGDSAVLNRIIGQNPSQILGALQSNGKVFLLNPNGILFGRGSQVNVNGLVASSLNLSDQDFLSGKRHFVGNANGGSVKNEGTITAGKGGQIYLIAPNVENSGIISAPNGDLLLAAGHSVHLVDASNPDIAVVLSNPANLAQNLGQMVAEGGRIGIYGTLVRQAGRVSADSAVLGENGKIIFKASRDTLLDAGSETSAKGAGKGGEIQVLGDRVAVLGNASVDASGATGGGSILVGGDMHGDNAKVQNASRTIFDSGATLRADAGRTGDGGKVVVWSDGLTNALGTISAKGGSLSGNGGFVETSGKKTLDFHAKVNLSASKGKVGTLLLDPDAIEIKGGPGEGMSTAGDGTDRFKGTTTDGTILFDDPEITTPSPPVSYIYQSEIEHLTSAAVVIEARNYISTSGTFDNGELLIPNNSNLTLRTRNGYLDSTGLKGINLTGSTDGADLKISAQGTGTITIETGKGTTPQAADILLPKLITDSGTVTVDGTGVVSVGKGIFTTDKNVSLRGSSINLAAHSTINAGGGEIELNAKASGGAINFGTGASLEVYGSATGNAVHLVADSIDLANGVINADSRRVLINPNDGTLGLDITSSKGSTHLDLTPAELNNITAGDLALNSFATTSISTPTSISNVNRVSLFGPAVSIQDALANTKTNGSILLQSSGSLSVGAAGSVTRNGSVGRIELVADAIDLSAAATGSLNAGTGAVSFVPNTNSYPIEFGGSPRGGALVLTPTDFDKVQASLLDVGSGNLNWDGGTTVKSVGFSTSYAGQLTLLGGNSTGTISIDGPLTTAGVLDLSSKKLLRVTTLGSLSASSILMEADQMQLQGAPGSISSGSGTTWIVPQTPGTKIDLGSVSDSTANTLEISNTELNTIGGNGTLRIGNVSGNNSAVAQSGDLLISDAIAPTFGGVVALESGGGITQTAGSVAINKLSLESVESINLGLGNNVNQLAAKVGDASHAGRDFKFVNNQTLNIAANLDGHSGINVYPAGTFDPFEPQGVISLTATGALTQSSGALLTGNAVYAEGSNVDLTQHNPIGVVAGRSTGSSGGDMWHYSSSNAIYVTTVDGHAGITHDGAAGTMSICLKAGSGGASQDADAPLISMLGGGVFMDTNGHVTFGSNSNNVGMVYGENTGAFTFINNASLTLGDGVHGIKPNNESIIVKANGKLTIASSVDAGTSSVLLEGKSIDIGAFVNGSSIDMAAKQTSGKIKTTAAVNIGTGATNAVLFEADTFDFTGGVPTINTAPSIGLLGFVNHSDDQVMTIDSKMAGVFISPKILYGNSNANDSNTTSGIVIGATLNQPSSVFGFSTTGAITQTAPIIAMGLGARGASAVLNSANQIHQIAAETNGGNFELTNTGALSVSSFTTGQGTLAGITTQNGAVNINNTGAISIDNPINSGTGNINVVAHSPLTVNAAVTSTNGNILLEAGSSNSTGDILTVAANGSVNTSGSITLKAGATVNIIGTVSGTPVIQDHLNTPPLPTIEECTATPTLPGCSTVLPTLPQCISTPTLPGCTVVLPSLTQCISNPAQFGCTAVLPTLTQCTATPTLPGCTVVLPNLTACIATPTLPGCSAVLPNLTACIATPTLPGCSVVLPNLTACIATPTLPGCSVVLPNLTACIATPTLPGCSVVLPNLTACIATPTLPGCSVVLPNLTACIATPTLPGCSVVLPNITACIATPTLPGCSVTLPNLTACIATPTLPGCEVVLPNITACIATPTLPGCSVTLPNLTACIATPTLPGCEVVLPNITACIATPTLPGCSVTLPNITACIATPTLPGCSVVLPNITACIATPTLPGCSVTLPNLTACIATPTLPGCSVVLPNITACIATPTLPGCNVTLPNLTACIATPTLPGCSVVLPNITACIATPTLPGCSVTLPNLTACIATPTLPGCSVVLPNITACIATPTLPGCTAVLPSLAQCTSNPALPGCAIILPPTQQQADEPVSQALNETVSVINTITAKQETIKPLAVIKPIVSTLTEEKSTAVPPVSGTTSSSDSKGEATTAKVEEKKDEKKDEKKETVLAKDTTPAKKDEPVKKLYCN